MNHTGCQWRELPHDLPPWETVYGYLRDLVDAGVWEAINDYLRRGVREQAGREPEPSVIIVDSQSVKTTEKRGTAADLMGENTSKDANGTSQLT
jgi:transposase